MKKNYIFIFFLTCLVESNAQWIKIAFPEDTVGTINYHSDRLYFDGYFQQFFCGIPFVFSEDSLIYSFYLRSDRADIIDDGKLVIPKVFGIDIKRE